MTDSSPKTQNEAPNQVNLLVWNIDPDLKRKFKAKCALEKRTIKDAITQLMTEYLNRQ